MKKILKTKVNNRICCGRCGKDITDEVNRKRELILTQYGLIGKDGKTLDLFCSECYFTEVDLAIGKYISENHYKNSMDKVGDIISYTKRIIASEGI